MTWQSQVGWALPEVILHARCGGGFVVLCGAGCQASLMCRFISCAVCFVPPLLPALQHLATRCCLQMCLWMWQKSRKWLAAPAGDAITFSELPQPGTPLPPACTIAAPTCL